jgi:hypothetical protein
MIAPAKSRRRKSRSRQIAEQFLAMLPLIREQARHAFRGERPERREELIAEVVANCWMSYVRLIDRGLHDVIYPTPLARFAIRQTRDGRRVGSKSNIKDVGSEYAQRRQGFTVETLDCLDQETGEWREILIEDRHAGPAETAAARIDVGDWFAGLGVQLPKWRYPAVCQLDTGEIRFDNFNGRWGEQQHLDRFLQMYAVEKAKIEARRRGNTCTEQQLADGSIKLTVNAGGAA